MCEVRRITENDIGNIVVESAIDRVLTRLTLQLWRGAHEERYHEVRKWVGRKKLRASASRRELSWF
jgi:hypothetical protein